MARNLSMTEEPKWLTPDLPKIEWEPMPREHCAGMVVSSYKLIEYCRKRYPKRTVIASPYMDSDDFYYWNQAEQLRVVKNKTELWVGDGWPKIKRKR